MNLLLIITDQQRADTLNKAGNPDIYTPNLDRLCETGIRYDQAYCESPECCPARSLIFSGQWGHRTGNMGNGLITPLETTFVEKLNKAGYHTENIGKMHSYPEGNNWGFQRVQRSEELGEMKRDDFKKYIVDLGLDWVYEPHGVRHEYYYIPQVSQLSDRCHNTTWVGNQTIEYMKQTQHDQPWFLTASFIKPHPPFDPTTPFLTMYDPADLPLPIRSDQDRTDMWPLQKGQNYSKWMELTDDNLARLIKAAYYACISQIDVQIGRMLDSLEENGMRDNTLIIFTSDHGEMLGDHYQWGKRSFYNGAARIPFILSCPGKLPEGAVNKDLVGHRDIAPTLLHAAGVLVHAEEWSGKSLLERIHNEEQEWRNITFGELVTNTYGVMSNELAEKVSSIYMAANQRWKYIYAPNGGKEALFDLEQDPLELTNLQFLPETQANKKQLRQALLSFFKEEGYTAGLSEDGEDLLEVPLTEVPAPRNRQYSMYDPYHKELRERRSHSNNMEDKS